MQKYSMVLKQKNFFITGLLILLTALLLFSEASAATITLAWNPNPPEDEVTGYKVYYGTSSGKYGSKINVGNVTTYTIAGLTFGQKYYFTVTAYDKFSNESDFSDEVNGFPKKEIELLTPNVTEILKSGSPYSIQWKINGTKSPVTKVNLYYTTDGGVSYALITSISTVDPGTRPWAMSHPWTVPTPLSNKKNTCYVKVVAYNGSTVVGLDASDKPFTIEGVRLIQPNGGETLSSGSSCPIQWEINGTKYPVTKVNLYYTTDVGTSWVLINTLAGSDRSYNWTVPTPLSNKKNTCYVKVVAYNGSTVVGSDTSDKPFTIEGVRLISPNGGEVLKSGTPWLIQWGINGTKSPVTKVNLYYTTDVGTSWVLINTLAGSDRSYNWTVPTPLSNKKNTCYVKVVAYNGSTVVGSDASDKPFTIEGVRLISPNGGEVLKSGSSWLIEWGINGTKYPVTKVNLYYTTDGGVSYVLINPIPLGDTSTSYNWTVPTPLSNKKNTCYVKVIAYNGSTVVGLDASDKPFTIEVVKVIQPNGGDTLSSGSSYPIQWEINGTKSPVTKVNLYWATDGGVSYVLINPTPLDGASRSYSWVPTVKGTRTMCKVKVVLYDTKNVILGSAVSDNYFTILLP